MPLSMFQFALRRGGETGVPKTFLAKLDLFKRKPQLVGTGRYAIRSDVDPDVFAMFMTRLWGGETEPVTPENAEQLRALCDELGFSGFDEELRAVQAAARDWRVRRDMVCVRGLVDRHDVLLEKLQLRVLELERRLAAFEAAPARVESVASRQEATARDLEELQRNDLSGDVAQLKMEVSERARVADLRALAEEVSRLKEAEAKRATTTPQAAAPAKKTPHLYPVAGPLPPLRPSAPGNVQAQRELELRYNDATPLEGVIAHLPRECGGNVHDKGVIEVTASKCWAGEDKNLADLGTRLDFWRHYGVNQWIRYDFKGWRVAPTSYSIKASHCESLRSWVLEASNDGTEGSWVVVDSRENNEDLKGEDVTHNFAISAPPSGSFRFVRLRQTGKNHNGANSLQLTSLELFGTLSPR